MRLVDLDPCWVSAGGDGVTVDGQPAPRRERVGVSVECPCGCDSRLYVPFANPPDDGPPLKGWQRTGETFEVLTLSPSIFRRSGCGWHGFITAGMIHPC